MGHATPARLARGTSLNSSPGLKPSRVDQAPDWACARPRLVQFRNRVLSCVASARPKWSDWTNLRTRGHLVGQLFYPGKGLKLHGWGKMCPSRSTIGFGTY